MKSENQSPAPLSSRLSRRTFFSQCSAAAGKVASSAVAAPLVIAAELDGAIGKKLRLGLLGVGQQGLKWAGAILENQGLSLAGWYDPDLNQMEKAAGMLERRGFNLPKAASSENCIWENPEIDAVIIASPSHLHFRQILKSIENGQHVLAEKPLGMSSAEFNEIQSLLQVNEKVVLMSAFSRRYSGHRRALLEWLKAEPLGRMLGVDVCWNQPQGPRQGWHGWMMDVARTGDWVAEHGDQIWDMLFELRPGMLPAVVKAVRKAGRDQPSRYFSAVLEYSDGVMTYIRHSLLPGGNFQSPGLSFLIQYEKGMVDLMSGRISGQIKPGTPKFEIDRAEDELNAMLIAFNSRIHAKPIEITVANSDELQRYHNILQLRNEISERFLEL